jgi:hypothetical protein
MALTLGMTGMDPATEAALKVAFEQANARSGRSWTLLPEAEAEHVVVDMDSMYGPMSWLRLHAAGKRVIGLTSAARTQTDFHLVRPFDANTLATLLRSIAGDTGVDTPVVAATPAPASPATPHPSGMAPAPVPQDLLPEEHPQPVDEEAEAPAPAPHLPGSVEAGSLGATTIEPVAAPLPPPPPPPPPPRERNLADWLGPNSTVSGCVRYQSAGGQSVLIDADARQYYGPALLKPLAGLFDGIVARDDFKPVDATTWASETAALGAPQPLGRLQWFGGLLAGKGELLPGYDPTGQYRLGKWPQTEREFPKHFRIATAMMKGPATMDEIAGASGVSLSEVADFINANLVTGYAEFVPEQPPEPTEPPKPVGLFGRLRGK